MDALYFAAAMAMITLTWMMFGVILHLIGHIIMNQLDKLFEHIHDIMNHVADLKR